MADDRKPVRHTKPLEVRVEYADEMTPAALERRADAYVRLVVALEVRMHDGQG